MQAQFAQLSKKVVTLKEEYNDKLKENILTDKLQIINNSSQYAMSFKVMSTHPDFYVVLPTKGQIDSSSNQELIIKRKLETSVQQISQERFKIQCSLIKQTPDEHCNFKIKIQLQQQPQVSELEKQQKNNEKSDLDLQNKQNIQRQEENEISQKQLQQSLRQKEQIQQENIQKLQNDQNVNEVIILHNDNNYQNKYQEASIDYLDMKKKLEQLQKEKEQLYKENLEIQQKIEKQKLNNQQHQSQRRHIFSIKTVILLCILAILLGFWM